MEFDIKDSGERMTFDSGMVRDTQTGKTLYSLVFDGPMFKRWAAHLTKGAVKYAAHNWMKATGAAELERFRESAIRHFVDWLDGNRDEDHAAGVFFNINGAEYVRDRMEEEPHATADATTPSMNVAEALRDREDVLASDLFIVDTHRPTRRGGRETELGIALGAGIDAWIVGPRINVFHHIVRAYPSWGAALAALFKEEGGAHDGCMHPDYCLEPHTPTRVELEDLFRPEEDPDFWLGWWQGRPARGLWPTPRGEQHRHSSEA